MSSPEVLAASTTLLGLMQHFISRKSRSVILIDEAEKVAGKVSIKHILQVLATSVASVF